MDADLRIAAVAAHQHAAFTRAQAYGVGFTPTMIRARLRLGRWGALFRDVFRIAGSEPTWEQKLFASWLAAGEGAVVSFVAAAWVWDVPGASKQLEVSVPTLRQIQLPDVTVHRASKLDAVDRVERDGLLVTTPTRLVIDLCADHPELASKAFDHCQSRRLTTPGYLLRRAEALGRAGRRGLDVLDALIAARPIDASSPESEFERRLLVVLSRLPGPPPIPQYEVRGRDGRRRRLDFAWPDDRLGIEAVSYLYHSSLGDWSADQSRYVELIAEGWRIIPITWVDLEQRPHWLLAQIQRARSLEVRDESAS
jgi:hypothetical protein